MKKIGQEHQLLKVNLFFNEKVRQFSLYYTIISSDKRRESSASGYNPKLRRFRPDVEKRCEAFERSYLRILSFYPEIKDVPGTQLRSSKKD